MSALSPITAYIALGSNIRPFENISKSIDILTDRFRILTQSSWYETTPYGFDKQDNFINLVIALETEITPYALLNSLKDIETQLERKRLQKNGPRTIDLDILLYGDSVIEEPDLTIPHSQLLLRDFMLTPLQEIAPHLIHPKTGLPLSSYEEVSFQHIIKKVSNASNG